MIEIQFTLYERDEFPRVINAKPELITLVTTTTKIRYSQRDYVTYKYRVGVEHEGKIITLPKRKDIAVLDIVNGALVVKIISKPLDITDDQLLNRLKETKVKSKDFFEAWV